MGKLFYLIGPSATGKDSFLKALLADRTLQLKELTQYTTRPIRPGEREGAEYHFITEEDVKRFDEAGKIIEERCYQTVYGPWRYLTIDDGSFDDAGENYVTAGTVESYRQTVRYFPSGYVIPLYVYVDPGERLLRAIYREQKNHTARYEELCRRFLADEADFSRDRLAEAGLISEEGEIVNRFDNDDFERCLAAMSAFIQEKI